MNANDMAIGTRVRVLFGFNQVPVHTEGVVDETYVLCGRRVWVIAWDLPGRRLPQGYCQVDDRVTAEHGILRDGFNIDELRFLQPLAETISHEQQE